MPYVILRNYAIHQNRTGYRVISVRLIIYNFFVLVEVWFFIVVVLAVVVLGTGSIMVLGGAL